MEDAVVLSEAITVKELGFVGKAKLWIEEQRQTYNYKQLKSELADIISQVNGLVEFSAPAGDERYVHLNQVATATINNFLNNNPLYSIKTINAAVPALETVKIMAQPPVESMSKLDEMKSQAKRAVVGIIGAGVVFTTASLVFGPAVLAYLHHAYAWWNNFL